MVVGESSSFGKGTVQTVIPALAMCARFWWARAAFSSPNRRSQPAASDGWSKNNVSWGMFIKQATSCLRPAASDAQAMDGAGSPLATTTRNVIL